MSFFPEVPEPEIPEEPEEWTPPEWLRPPADEIPAEVPLGLTLFASDRLVVTVSRAAVYSNGCAFAVRCDARRLDESAAEWEATYGRFHPHFGTPVAGMLRFGIEYSDGSRVTTVPDHATADMMARPESQSLILEPGGGSGGQRRSTTDAAVWAWPLPPDGPLTLVVEWREQGVPETHVPFGSIAFRELAASARPMWA